MPLSRVLPVPKTPTFRVVPAHENLLFVFVLVPKTPPFMCWSTHPRGIRVTFHGIQFPREYSIIVVSLVPLGHIRMWRVRLPWETRVTCSRVSWRALYRERRS